MKCRVRRWLQWLILFGCLGPVVIHRGVDSWTRMIPPPLRVPQGGEHQSEGVHYWGHSYVTRRGSVLEVRLAGTAEEIGYAHMRLLHDSMAEIEHVLHKRFQEVVPWWLGRLVLVDLAEVRFRRLDQALEASRRRELAAMALGFTPDPFAEFMPTFPRLVYLNSLYDISLSFERSPLVGCTTFVLSGDSVMGGGTLVARTFDFEIDEVFDRGKVVFLVEEDGLIPFASVAWPGLIGAVTGMNSEGLAVVAQGARAGVTLTAGEPVTLELRRVLSTAHNAEQAVRALTAAEALVSHLVIVADAQDRAAVVERVPASKAYVRWLGRRAAITNHFEGPAAADPKNQRVRAATSTLARRTRADELLAQLAYPITVQDAVSLLRDRRGPGDTALALGDRRAIDALIATHGVVMNTTERVLWVSEGPHLMGRFLAFDLKELLDSRYHPKTGPVETIAPDPLLSGQQYAHWRAEHPRAAWR